MSASKFNAISFPVEQFTLKHDKTRNPLCLHAIRSNPTFEGLRDVSIPSLVVKNINNKDDKLLFLSTNPTGAVKLCNLSCNLSRNALRKVGWNRCISRTKFYFLQQLQTAKCLATFSAVAYIVHCFVRLVSRWCCKTNCTKYSQCNSALMLFLNCHGQTRPIKLHTELDSWKFVKAS